MFTVQRPAPEPANCPYCPYFPVSLVDLQVHLDESHCAAGFKVCSTAGCGFVVASARDLTNHCKLVHNTKRKRKHGSNPQVCIRHILRKEKVEKKRVLKSQIGFIKKDLIFVENILQEIQEKILRIHLHLRYSKTMISLKEKVEKKSYKL